MIFDPRPARARRRRRRKPESLDAARERMIAETELALVVGLCRPGQFVRIPTVEVGQGNFEPAFAERFWNAALGLDGRSRSLLFTARWRPHSGIAGARHGAQGS